jgi:drug/metabolite transporter (DMT)-like permease
MEFFTKQDIVASGYGVLYAVSSAGEALAVKALNYNTVPLQLPIYTALLSNQLWIFMLPLYWIQREERWSLKDSYWGQYCIIGCLTFTITLLRNISLNLLPGSVFSLLISTSILFNIVLSKLCLNKVFTYWHLSAAFFCLASACSIGFAALFTSQEEFKGTDYKIGVITAILSAFFGALMSVTQEYIQPTWDNYNIRIVDITIISSLIATVLIVIYGTFGKELVTWAPSITMATQSQEGLILVTSVSCILPILKLLARNTKYATIKNSSAFFFEFAQASSSLIGSVSSILIFEEPWGPGYIAAIVLMTISFGLYMQTKRDVVMPPPPDYPKGEIRVKNPLARTTTNVQEVNGNTVVIVTLWK